jgi:YHS domain-containing protein
MASPLSLNRSKLWLICGLIAASWPLAAASVRGPDHAAHVIHDPRSGLAIFGHDPVAYHTEGVATAGRQRFTAEVGGLAWRFASAANMAAFKASPEPYIPLYGGHDARGVAEGRMVVGDPAIFLLAGGRTVFFRTVENRDAFARDEKLRRSAVENWPRVAAQLAGH